MTMKRLALFGWALLSIAVLFSSFDATDDPSSGVPSSFPAAGLLFLGASARNVAVSVTECTLLSGGLEGCTPFMNQSSCRRGIAEALLQHRRFESTSLLIPRADWDDAFAQMHPKQWAVNGETFHHFGIKSFIATQSLLTATAQQWPDPALTPLPLLLSNVVMDSGNGWFSRTEALRVDTATGLAVLYARLSNQPASTPLEAAVLSLVKIARSMPAVTTIIVLVNNKNATEMAMQLAAAGTPAHAVVDVGTDSPPVLVGTTWCGASKVGSKVLTVVEVDHVPGTTTATALRLRERDLEIDAAVRLADAQYVTDQTYMQGLATAAASNNPIVGQSLNVMPVVRDSGYRACYGGECELGDVWADALLWRGAADVAFIPSGGIRGPGWPIGPIRISNIFASDPFQNFMCMGSVLGVTLFQILNRSTMLAGFVSEKTTTGDRLLQISGLRVTYNTQLIPANRLLKVEVFNNETSAFEPLERLKVYKYATVSFLCDVFDDYPSLFRSGLKGEVAPSLTEEIIQNVVRSYLTTKSPLTVPTIGSRMLNDTSAAAIVSWIQMPSTCGSSSVWDKSVTSCIACAAGQIADSSGLTCIVPATTSSNTSTVIAIAVPVGALLLIAVIGAVLFSMCRQGDVRDVGNAPRKNPITILFTDVQASTLLWSVAPASMSDALETHHRVIRSCIAKHKAYEVKTAGDAFMIAASSASVGVQLAMDIQMALLNETWPTAIDSIYTQHLSGLEPVVDDDPERTTDYTTGPWHGIRVRIGMHSGEAEVKFDEVAKGYDYYGPPVNMAARVESKTHGGEVCATTEVVAGITDEQRRTLRITSRGDHEFKGVPEPIEVIQIIPGPVAERKYFDAVTTMDGGDADDGTDNGSVVPDTLESSDNNADNFVPFVKACFRALKKADNDIVLSKLRKAWHVPHKATEDQLFMLLARRAASALPPKDKLMQSRRLSNQRRSPSVTSNIFLPTEMAIMSSPRAAETDSPKSGRSQRGMSRSGQRSGTRSPGQKSPAAPLAII